MTDHDDRDLSSPFEELRAPRSSAAYGQRRPRPEIVRPSRSWMRAAGAATAVVVAIGGAATFVGLRNARGNDSATSSSGAVPAARSGAAMAFDSTTGTTVMFGGTGGNGRALADTWAWDGSGWARLAAGSGPPALVGAHLSDDPTGGGALLIGMAEPPSANARYACAVTGSGSATGATTVAPAPPVPATASPGVAGGGPSIGVPLQTKPPPGVKAVPACPLVPPATVQTWLLRAGVWSRVASDLAGSADTPASFAQVAFDSSTGEVVAVSPAYWSLSGCGTSTLVCPMMGSASAGQSAPISSMPCRLVSGGSCGLGGATVKTWTWSHGRWTARQTSKGPQPAAAGNVALVTATAGRHAYLVTETATAYACPSGTLCPAVAEPAFAQPALKVWRWSASGWTAGPSTPLGTSLNLGSSSFTGVGDGALVVGSDGVARSLNLVSGAVTPAGSVPARLEAAMAPSASGSVVLFGGLAAMGKSGIAYSAGPSLSAPGSDTWRWDGHAWSHLSGAEPRVEATPPCDIQAMHGCVPIPQVAPSGAPATSPAPPVSPLPPTVTATGSGGSGALAP